MKKSYTCFLVSLLVFVLNTFSQSNPTPHVLSSGDFIFSNFNVNPGNTVYPTSIQGWSGTVTTLQTTASGTLQANGDEPLCSGCGSGVGTINNEGVNGFGLQSQNSATKQGSAFALALALNTTNCYNIKVAWLGIIIDWIGNEANVGGLQLQYRIGSTGNWTNLQNQIILANSATVVGKDHIDFVSALPAALNNLPLVQLRWMIITQNNFTFGSQFGLSKIHIMPDSIAGTDPSYCRAGGNTDSTGAVPYFTPYDPLYISRVTSFSGATTTFDNNNTRAGIVNGYSDYTNMVLPIEAGEAFDIDIVSGGGYIIPPETDNSGVYIDWNQDLDFDDPDEFFKGTNSQGFTSHIANITVPATAKSGYTRMRARLTRPDFELTPCGPAPDGETEDYTLLVTNPLTPLPACVPNTGTFPLNGANNVCTGVDSLKWTGVADATSYRLTMYDSATSARIFDNVPVTATAQKIGVALNAGSTYKWIAVATNDNGSAVNCDTIIFRTSPNLDPVADILPSQDTVLGCMFQALQLDGNPTLGTAPYSTHQWTGVGNPTSGLSSTSSQTTDLNATTGLYKFAYKITDANGCFDTDTVNVKIRQSPQVSLPVAADNALCAGETTTLTFNASAGSVVTWEDLDNSHDWQSTSTVTSAGGSSYNLPVLNSTISYRATATFAESGCAVISDPVEITVNPLPLVPTIMVTQNSVVCDGDEVMLFAPTSDKVQWNDANNTVNNTLIVKNSGTYIATLTTPEGCSANSAPTTITFNPRPAQPVVSSSGSLTACTGDEITLTATSSGPVKWNDANNTAGSTLKVTTSGSYIATTIGPNGCSNSSVPQNITFNNPPAKPVIQVSGSAPYCNGDIITLTSSYSTGNLWSNGSTASSITVTSTGNYSVTETDANGCSSASDALTLTFNPSPALPVITQNANTITSSSTGDSYQWYNANGPVANATAQSFNPPATGEYWVVVSFSNGCSSESAKYYFSGVGISESGVFSTVSLYPNPNNGHFIIDLSLLKEKTTISITDLAGKLVYQEIYTQGRHELSVNLDNGLYMLRLDSSSGSKVIPLTIQ